MPDHFIKPTPEQLQAQFEATKERRGVLVMKPAPNISSDFIVSLYGTINSESIGSPISLVAYYVPHRDVVTPESFSDYLRVVAGQGLDTLEDVAGAVLSDLSNEALPRWTAVQAKVELSGETGLNQHGVMLEDRQPGWNNQLLLSRVQFS